MTAVLTARDVSKSFGSFEALMPMDFELAAGEVRGLVGSNGAGKTTFIKVLTGAHAPTTGTVIVNGKELPAGSPVAFLDAGIACIYQHSSLAPNLSVLENLYLGRHPAGRLGVVNRKELRESGNALIAEHQIDVDLDALVEDLPTVKQKEIEILKALALSAKVILMDEPTASLSFSEVKRLHATVTKLKATGVAIVYISHMMDEIFQVCDSVSVLRDGKLVWNGEVAETNRPSLVKHMLGDSAPKEADGGASIRRVPGGNGTIKLAAKGLSRRGLFEDVSFELFAGEILCITGLIGAGRTELLRCLFGADRLDKGTLEIDGQPVTLKNPRHAIELGIGFVPEDRHRDGLFLSHSISENLPMAGLHRVTSGPVLRQDLISNVAARQIEDLNIVPPDSSRLVGWLSGGNQQKTLLAKWLETHPSILILDEPTVGVDVGAKSEIYGIMNRLKNQGAAVLVVSSDIEEVQTISDRIAVMVNGKLHPSFDATNITHESLVSKVSGSTDL